MESNDEISIKQEANQVSINRPHVVVLGAGASRATCLDGDKNGKNLPLTSDFVKVLGLKSLLEQWKINPDKNFEEIFSDLYERQQTEKIMEIRGIVKNYFNELELPEKPTIYDHLVLSLRDKDIIATFNWDPLLLQAYSRCSKVGLSLPKLAFLHGNILVGYCEKDKIVTLRGICRKCGEFNTPSPLLYPIKNKNYADKFIENEWQLLKWGFENAFMITIFGYSKPETDQEAIAAMQNAWGDKNKRLLEQTEVIDIKTENQIYEDWKPFIHTHHYEVHSNFYDSWISNHPRRTGEAWFNQYLQAKFIDNNPIPKNLGFPDLFGWYKQFYNAERQNPSFSAKLRTNYME